MPRTSLLAPSLTLQGKRSGWGGAPRVTGHSLPPRSNARRGLWGRQAVARGEGRGRPGR